MDIHYKTNKQWRKPAIYQAFDWHDHFYQWHLSIREVDLPVYFFHDPHVPQYQNYVLSL